MNESLVLIGLGCIIAAIVGGGLKAFGIEFAPLGSLFRQALLFVFGVFLAILGFVLPTIGPNGTTNVSPSPQATAAATPSQTPSPTPTSAPTPTLTPTPPPLSYRGQLAGAWRLDRWVEATGPITLYVDISDGTLDLSPNGRVTWLMSIRERGEDPHPVPGLTCVGEVPLEGGALNGIPGGEEKDWTSDLRSIREDLLLALCGWSYQKGTAPFHLVHDGTVERPATSLEMTNEKGTYVWTR